MATSVHDMILKPLQAYLGRLAKDRRDVHDAIQQCTTELFVEIAGDYLSPTTVGLVFVSDNPWPGGAVEALDSWWTNEASDLSDPFTTTANRFLIATETPLSELRRWIPIDLSRLGTS
jgi:hypothetical protein